MRNYLTRKNDVITCVVGLSWERYKMIFFITFSDLNTIQEIQVMIIRFFFFYECCLFSRHRRVAWWKKEISARSWDFVCSQLAKSKFSDLLFSPCRVWREKKLKITKITTRVPHEWICIALEILQFHGLGI